MPFSRHCFPKIWTGVGLGLLVIASLVLPGPADAVTPLWDIPLPPDLQAQVYETALPPGKPLVIGTSPTQVFQIDSGRLATLFPVDRKNGESPILAGFGTVVGMLLHQLHDIAGFELRDLNGKLLAKLDDPRHFQYRIAPDGSAFVGIDAGGEHTAPTAPEFLYRFFSSGGDLINKEGIRSPGPQPPVDSAYAPDSQAFLISNREGLAAFHPQDQRLLWQIKSLVKLFAPANGATGRVLVSNATRRHIAELYEKGKQLWQFDLSRFKVSGNIRNVAIAPLGEFAAVSSAHTLFLLGPKSEQPLASVDVGRDLVINAVAVSDKGLVALGAQQAGLKETEGAVGTVMVLDASGKELFRQDTKHERSNAWIPMVQFDATGRFLLVRTLEQLTLLDTAK